MKIGINGFEAVIPRFGYDSNGLPNRVGSSEVCFQILSELYKIDKKNEYRIYLPVQPTSDMPKEREGWHYEIIPNKKLWTIFGLSKRLMSRSNLDVFFSPTHYGTMFTSIPEVITVLDVSYKQFPELFKKKDLLQLNLWGGYSVKKATKIITISNSSKNDIIREYHVDPEKVKVVYLGLKFQNPSTKHQINSKMENYKPYVLFVGTIQPRKNLVRLIEAFSKLDPPAGGKNFKLVIIGRRGWHYEEILDAPKKFGVEDSVRFLESVTDDELPAFYQNAKLFVLPSLYEGFGLPVLEAMKYGCPVAASNISSLPEAGGDAAVYFDPENVGDIAEKMEKVLSNKNLRDDMIKKGHEQVKKFSWEKSAREVLKVLEETAR